MVQGIRKQVKKEWCEGRRDKARYFVMEVLKGGRHIFVRVGQPHGAPIPNLRIMSICECLSQKYGEPECEGTKVRPLLNSFSYSPSLAGIPSMLSLS